MLSLLQQLINHSSSPEVSFLSCSLLQYYRGAMPNAKIRKKNYDLSVKSFNFLQHSQTHPSLLCPLLQNLIPLIPKRAPWERDEVWERWSIYSVIDVGIFCIPLLLYSREECMHFLAKQCFHKSSLDTHLSECTHTLQYLQRSSGWIRHLYKRSHCWQATPQYSK